MKGIIVLAGAHKRMLARRHTLGVLVIVRILELCFYSQIVGLPIASLWMLFVVITGIWTAKVGAKLTDNPTSPVAPFFIAYVSETVAFSSLAVLLWSHQDRYGGVVATILLAYGVMRAVLESRGSRGMWVGLMIQLAFFIIAPLCTLISHIGFLPPASYWLACGLLVFAASGWGIEFAEADAQAATALQDAAVAFETAELRRQEAEAATAAKSAFIAMVSHDLRTPISGVLAAAEELKRRQGDPNAAERVGEMVSAAGGMMRTLLNDLLDLSKIEAGRMTVESIRFDLAALLENVCGFHLMEAKTKGLELNFITDNPPSQIVEGDPTRIQQILNNLLSNALKFTKAGSITLSQHCERHEDGGLTLQLTVTDTGPGLSPDRLSRLFNPYEQTDASVARSHGGTGLGLCISRDLARLMDGDITVSSDEGCGAVFTVTLRLQQGGSQALEPENPPSHDQPPANLRLLIAEDHEMNRAVLRVLLEPLDAELYFVEDGEAALEALQQTAFDLILTDLQMPKVDGLELARRVRAGVGPNQATPMIALTGSGRPEDVDACMEAGMDGHVTKPLEANMLFQTMAAVLDADRRLQTASSEDSAVRRQIL